MVMSGVEGRIALVGKKVLRKGWTELTGALAGAKCRGESRDVG